ncbi:MAG: hypothetical protein ABI797_07095, partial [Chloroflexota bacterium]
MVAIAFLVVATLPAMNVSGHGGDEECPSGTTEFKFDINGSGADGTYSDGFLSVIIDFTNSGGEAKSFSFASNIDVTRVLVKGGPTSNVYNYSSGTRSGSGLTAPDNKGISNIRFCYPPDQRTPTPTPTKTPTPTPTKTPTPTPTKTPTPTPTPTKTPTPTPTKTPTPTPTPTPTK